MTSKILTIVIYSFVRLLHMTWRYRVVNKEVVEKLKSTGNGGYILSVWHQYVLSTTMGQNRFQHVCIVSRSKDADPVAFTVKRYGHICVRGSSRKGNKDKGGKEAKETMIEHLSKGIPGAITVDGPKGPAREVKPGVVDMAKKSKSPILPYSCVPESFWEFKSWDRFRLPKPFSRLVVKFGEPIHVTENDSFESVQTRLQTSLNQIVEESYTEFKNWDQLSANDW